MRNIRWAALLAFLLFMAACSSTETPGGVQQSEPPSAEVEMEDGALVAVDIIKDNEFRRGYALKGLVSSSEIIELMPTLDADPTPAWMLAQWGSNHNLEGLSPKVDEDGRVIYQNQAKAVTLTPREGGARVKLESWTSKDYERTRVANEDWVHLLLEQYLEDTKLSTFEKMNFHIRARLVASENMMAPEEYDTNLHTAQFSTIFIIADKNPASPHFNDFFWFGLPLYDYRYEDIPLYAAPDVGKDDATGKFIQSVSSDSLFEGSLHDGEWKTIDMDILPLIVKSFEIAQKRGYLQESAFEDLVLSSMNIGWEIPGTFDVAIEFEDIRLQGMMLDEE